jgi:hypothetical protein
VQLNTFRRNVHSPVIGRRWGCAVKLISFAAWISLAPHTAWAAPVTAEFKNLLTLIESTHTDLMFLSVFHGDETERQLTGRGTFDANGWTWSIADSFRGMPLSLSYTGTYSAATDSGVWEAAGTFGAKSWHTTGTVRFFDETQAELMFIGSIADPDEWRVILGGRFEFASGGNSWTVFGGGEYRYHSDPEDPFSREVTVRDTGSASSTGPLRYEKEGELTLHEDDLRLNTRLTAAGTTEGGSITTQIAVSNQPIPEPSTLVLVGTPLVFGVRHRIRRYMRGVLSGNAP